MRLETDVHSQLGLRIKFLRNERKWTQEELAFVSHINKNYLCDLENGKRNPTLDILNRLANAFGITISDLLKGIRELRI